MQQCVVWLSYNVPLSVDLHCKSQGPQSLWPHSSGSWGTPVAAGALEEIRAAHSTAAFLKEGAKGPLRDHRVDVP